MFIITISVSFCANIEFANFSFDLTKVFSWTSWK